MEKIMKTSLLVNQGVPLDDVYNCIRDTFFGYPGLIKFEQNIGDPGVQKIDITFQFRTEEVDVMELIEKLQQIKKDRFIVSIEP